MWPSFLRYMLERFVNLGLKYLSIYESWILICMESTQPLHIESNHGSMASALFPALYLGTDWWWLMIPFVLLPYLLLARHFCFTFANTFFTDVMVTYKACLNKKLTAVWLWSDCLQLHLCYTVQSYYQLFQINAQFARFQYFTILYVVCL